MRRSVSTAVLVAAAATVFATDASAHIGGHAGGFTNGLAHPFYGLDHVLAMVAVGIWASQLGRPAIWLLPLTFPLVMIAGASLGLSGVSLPWLETGIAATVIALGAAIAFAVRPPVAISAALIGVFALFHGFEHGVSLPAHGNALTYGAGFVLATLALHAVGLGLGLAARYPLALRTAGGAIAAVGVVLLIAH